MSNKDTIILLTVGLCFGGLLGSAGGLYAGYRKGYDKAMNDAGDFIVKACHEQNGFVIHKGKHNFVCFPVKP